MDSEQRRKRKRISRFYFYSYSRYIALCLFILALFSFYLSDRILVSPPDFRSLLLPSIFSSSPERFRLDAFLSPFPLRIEDRLLFPDYLLLLVSSGNPRSTIHDEYHCVYYKNRNSNQIVSAHRINNILSAEEYDDRRLIVRCPLPPDNYSVVVNLQTRGRNGISSDDKTVHSWETIVYEAVMYDDTVVVFVKGLNLRSGRESDPSQFNCHFGLGNWEKSRTYVLTSKAITAAQEVVRCLLPRTVKMNPEKADGIRITIETQPQPHTHINPNNNRVLLPSVAKMFQFPKKINKYNLCVCTMVWNQASSLREWIIYHSWLGVQRWFIYDNNSDDEIKEVIKELQQENYNITRHVWPWIKTQEAGFSHCAMRSRDECNWVGFFDVDEFFYFPYPNRKKHKGTNLGFPGKNSLTCLVANFSSSPIAEIRTACHSFGPSGLNTLPSQGVTIGYTCRLQSPERHKSIVRPEALDDTLLNVVHHFRLRKGYRYLNLPQSTAVINHYKYQVWEAFRAKFYRRVATYVVDWRENQNEGSRDRAPGLGTEAIEPPNWQLQFCEVWDTGLKDFMLTNLADPSTGLLPWEKIDSVVLR